MRHTDLKRRDIEKDCECGIWWACRKMEFSKREVLRMCKKCGQVVSRYYRAKLWDTQKYKHDFEVGEIIKARRIVAWCGYAVDPGMIQFDMDEEEEMQKRICEESLGIKKPRPRHKYVPTESPANKDWFIVALQERARYIMIGELMEKSGNVRGLWFQDVSMHGKIIDTVRCQTGILTYPTYRGHPDEDYTPYLSRCIHHQLYVVENQISQGRAMIYPPDALRAEKSEAELYKEK